ncbi:AI-2E family transporter [Francisellaceae bacterium CB299]|jgi:predicted PurR-regulated permease PerM
MNYSSIKKLSVVLFVTGLAIWILYPFTYAILFAGLLAIILAPVQQRLEVHIGKSKSSFLIAMTILLCIFIPLLLILSYAITEIIQYVEHSESLAASVTQLGDSLSKIPYIGDYAQEQLAKFVVSIQQDKQKIIANLDRILPTVKYIGSASVSLVTGFLVALLLVFQFLVSSTSLEKFFKKVVLKDFQDGDSFISTAITTTRRVSVAILLTALIAGITMGIVYASIGLPSPVLFGFITAIASMVPFMVTIVYIALAIGVFVFYGATKAIILIVIGVVLNMFTDNIMQPKIINKEVKLSFAASLLGIMGGIQAFGFIGIFLGPVIFNVAFVGIQKLMDGKEY